MHTYIHTHTYTHTYIHTYTRTYIHIYIHTHIHCCKTEVFFLMDWSPRLLEKMHASPCTRSVKQYHRHALTVLGERLQFDSVIVDGGLLRLLHKVHHRRLAIGRRYITWYSIFYHIDESINNDIDRPSVYWLK